MVFLDQEGVVQADAVVVAAAAGHRIFLGGAQAGDGFAGIQQLHACSLDDVGITATNRCGAGQRLQEIQCATFTREQAAGLALQFKQHLIRLGQAAILYVPGDDGGGVDLAKDFVDPFHAADDGLFPGDDPGVGGIARWNQAGGDVAGADVLFQGEGNGAGDVEAAVVGSHQAFLKYS